MGDYLLANKPLYVLGGSQPTNVFCALGRHQVFTCFEERIARIVQCLSITLQCGGLLHLLKALASIKLRNAATSTRKVSWHSEKRSTRLELLCIFFAFLFGIIAL